MARRDAAIKKVEQEIHGSTLVLGEGYPLVMSK